MLCSASLLCFCSLLIFEHAEFLLRHIGLYLGNICLSLEIFRASPLRCAPVYRHNVIVVIIVGKPNKANKESARAGLITRGRNYAEN